ncbi:NAD(P) transhydrogenase subunit alpha [Spongiibacter sp. KMU-158]|uniref:proton-translocating NAD(P)(+) transhydrogenase n=1 Tax=Spongiibacter pelagi TaxID=2760804 RepID=A0A927C390_9GAMM|nr:NAD(P) transhydrogenase subunit alpha [Spongiibacter pelagi]MBD2858966.1 NAD(P) transhydrogenase subunit alpha [Spongiibacter pelagi]
MLIGIPKELAQGENRVAIIPSDAKKLVRAGASVMIESGIGLGSGYSDNDYVEAGATVGERANVVSTADIVLRIAKPNIDEVKQLKAGCIHISYLDPFNEHDLIKAFRDQNVTAISMEMIPRSTRSQKMDALSSQASLAGYVMVLLATTKLPRILPMMMTPAGTLKPATVFIIGAGVAGLQAIATAKRLGAKVVAFDTRSVVAEQVRSLGGKFLEIDLGETGQTKDGYAVELTEEQRQLQLEGQKKQIAESDIVITTAQVFGRKPPLLVTKDMVAGMKPGSVIVDMAGGNVEGTVPGQTVVVDGVTIIGDGNWSNYVATDASQMYSSNLFNLVDEGWDKEKSAMVIDFENDILQGCVITHGGEITNATIKEIIK